MAKQKLVFSDRYSAVGMKSPNIETICKGQCEGMGIVPVRKTSEEPFRTLWLKAEKKKKSTDGYHFVKCPDCKGTGKTKK